jgi:tRNA (mo5U34)-methyltransferase
MPAVMDLLDRARAHPWYHTLELPGHTTDGIFDLRPHVPRYGIPADLSGRRVLEIGTWDGFWAFELERRGAAEVHAIDLDDEAALDWPPRRRPQAFPEVPRGGGFAIARELLGSTVQRHVLSVYDATPERLGGRFDLVFCGSVLIHLRDQLLALERIAGLLAPGGLFISAEEYDRLPLPVARFHANREKAVVFWLPTRRAWRQMIWYAGFDEVRSVGTFDMRSTQGWGVRHVVHHARR